jgi:hypothetical protein
MPETRPSPIRRGNIFCIEKLQKDLRNVRANIARAVLIGYGRRQLRPGEEFPDLARMRKLESELIVRLDMVGGEA